MNKEDEKVLSCLDAEEQRIEREYDLKFDEGALDEFNWRSAK